jgi:hypothetical protein
MINDLEAIVDVEGVVRESATFNTPSTAYTELQGWWPQGVRMTMWGVYQKLGRSSSK